MFLLSVEVCLGFYLCLAVEEEAYEEAEEEAPKDETEIQVVR